MDLGFRQKEVFSLLASTDGRNCSGVKLEEEKSDWVGTGDRKRGFMVQKCGPILDG